MRREEVLLIGDRIMEVNCYVELFIVFQGFFSRGILKRQAIEYLLKKQALKYYKEYYCIIMAFSPDQDIILLSLIKLL